MEAQDNEQKIKPVTEDSMKVKRKWKKPLSGECDS